MDPIRARKSPINPERRTGADSTPTPAEKPAAEKKMPTASAKEFLQRQSSAYTVDRNTGQVNFGDGVSGRVPPSGEAPGKFFQDTKLAISQYLQGAQPGEDLFAALMAYLKMTQKDAREDRKLQRASKETALMAQEAKLKLDNAAIDKGMKEAGEKADAAMQQATTTLVTGMVSAVSSLRGTAVQAKQGLGENNSAVETRYNHFMLSLENFAAASAKLAQAGNFADAQTKRLENQARQVDEGSKSSGDHVDRMRDAIRDFLRKLAEINPKV